MSSIQHLVKEHAITTAQSIATRGKVHKLPDSCTGLLAQVIFVDGGGGTTIDVFIQTTFDDQTTWVDIMQFAFLVTAGTQIMSVRGDTAIIADIAPTDGGGPGDGIAIDGLIGSHVRARIVTTGTYTGTTTIDVRLKIED